MITFMKSIYDSLRIPIELLLIILYLAFRTLFQFRLLLSTSMESQFLHALVVFSHNLILWCIVLLLGLVYTINASGRRGDLFLFFCIGFIFHFILVTDNLYLYYMFCGIIILTELSRTRWMEELSKTECWIYLIAVALFYTLNNLNVPYIFPLKTDTPTILLETMPFYMFRLFKFYLLAMLIKLPIVLIYNHAGLSRKLKISGLFQSTVPQFIQFFILVLMFYLFISSWQAQNLRNQISRLLTDVEDSKQDTIVDYWKFDFREHGGVDAFVLIDHAKISLSKLPDNGVLDISEDDGIRDSSRVCECLLFFRQKKDSLDFYYFVKIDSVFMQAISRNIQVLAGTSIMAHTIMPSKWTSYLYEFDFMQGRRFFHYFPFGSFPLKIKSELSADLLPPTNDATNRRHYFQTLIKDEPQLSFGRVYIPMLGLHKETDRFFAIDIVLTIGDDLLWSGLPQIFLLLLLIYLLINSLIIQRVITFGSQINKMIVNKFAQLKSGIREISSGNLDYKIKLGGEDEFVELAEHFNEMSDKLKQTMEEVREKDRLQYELQLARQVQLNLLPVRLPDIPRYDVFASMETATEVGGDFYDMVNLGNGRYLFSIGDVSGKGSSAALYMAQYMSLFRYSRQFTNEPKKIASELNDYFASNIIDLQMFITAIIGLLDTKTDTIQIVRMGHTEPILMPADNRKKIQTIKAEGIGIGLTRKSKTFDRLVTSNELSMSVGDTLFMYTDGIIEANKINEDEESADSVIIYGEERLCEFLNANRDRTPYELSAVLKKDIEDFYDSAPRVDDQTLLIIRRTA